MDAREELNRAKWASRRGLLELDLLLSPFVNSAFDALSDELKDDYRALLFNDDQDLMEWIMGRAEVADSRFTAVVSAIRQFHGMVG
ncbi:MAG: succinate dehydrogenase assembly factor 2 [Halieaceae bacterium]